MQNGTEESVKSGRPLLAHVMPFVVWVGIMSLPIANFGWRYAIQSMASAVCFVWLQPWRYYPRVRIRTLPVAVAVGVGVWGVWVLPESPWMFHFPFAHDLYLRYGVRPLGIIAGSEAVSPYAPEQGGWGLALTRLIGSAGVIAVAEEFFWRGFLSRWLVSRDFLQVDPRKVHGAMFVLTALLFGMEHERWLAGVIAGFAYGLLYVRTGDIWSAVVAHVVTNYLLGLYVLATASYYFW